MRRRIVSRLCFWLAASCSLAACGLLLVVNGQSPASPASPAEPSKAEPAAAAEPIKASNVVVLRKNVGRQVTVYGRIDRTASTRSGTEFLNFAQSELSIVCFKNDVVKFGEGRPSKLYRDKEIQVRGVLELYKGKLQIKLSDPDQIRLAGGRPSTRPPPRAVALKKVGKDAWLSPAGLRYEGRDPEGRTRVEHILRHAQDMPQREGPHGVFDDGEEAAFGLIDEAWKLAQKKKLRPRVEGDRSTYLVSMGRRVGYLGGSQGKQRRHPALSRVFIVFETGTSNIITAFPR